MRINHRELHIEQYGDSLSPTIILLHHGLGSTRAWREQVQPLISAGYNLILYDRWGYGKSERRPHLEVPSFKDDLADLKAIINYFNLSSPILIGHSDGGTISLYHAIQNPISVSTLVVVAAHIYLEPKMEPGIQAIQRAFEHDIHFRKGLERAHGEKYESTFYNWFNGWHNPRALVWDMRPLIKNIRCPVLVIQGSSDEHATSQHAIDIAENIPSSEIWLVPNAGHMLPQEMPAEFNRKVLNFLKTNAE